MMKLNRDRIIVGCRDIQHRADLFEDRELTDEEFEALNKMVKEKFGMDLDPGDKE